jgi:SNF2 family DNA or RNA helicase
MLPDAANIDGSTSEAERETLIEQFKSGARRVLITKPRILGFGLNLQVATRHIFSGLQDSYEEYYQAVKRSNRYGSTKPLNVHIPVTEIERPMIDTVLEKASRVESDTREQERLFKVAKEV